MEWKNQNQTLLTSIEEDLVKALQLPCSAQLEKVKNVFFISGAPFLSMEELSEKLSFLIRKYEDAIQFSIFYLDTHQFIGQYEYGKALAKNLGGRYWQQQNFAGFPILTLWESSIYPQDPLENQNFDYKQAAQNASPFKIEDVVALF